jgi:hypothetical protein
MNRHGKAEQQAARRARLSAALRENLKRRKAQARDRRKDRADAMEEPTAKSRLESDAPDFRRNRRSD